MFSALVEQLPTEDLTAPLNAAPGISCPLCKLGVNRVLKSLSAAELFPSKWDSLLKKVDAEKVCTMQGACESQKQASKKPEPALEARNGGGLKDDPNACVNRNWDQIDKLYKELYAGCLKLGRSAAQELGGDPGDTLNFMCTFSMAATLAKVCPGYLLSEIYSDSKEILKGKN